MSQINNKTVISSSTAASDRRIYIEKEANLFLIDGGDIASDTIPIKLVEPGNASGVQAKFNGTAYQLDASNVIIRIAGPAVLLVNKGVTTNAVGVGAYSAGGLKIE